MVPMSVFRSCHLTLLLFASGSLALLGCQDNQNPNNPTSLVPVGGSVTLDGSPVAKGVISFAPDVGNPVRVAPTGQLDGGQYQLSIGGKAGAPPGKYKVCVLLDPAAEEARVKAPQRTQPSIPRKYHSPDTTPLTVEVVVLPNPGAYDLKLSTK